MPDTMISFDDVELMDRDSLGFRCRVGSKIVYVGSLQPQPGTTIRLRGDRGRLVLRRQDAWDLGLVDRPP